jgi:hypothetical protein
MAETQSLSVSKINSDGFLVQSPDCESAAPHESKHLGQFSTASVTPCSPAEDAGQAGRCNQPDTLAA